MAKTLTLRLSESDSELLDELISSNPEIKTNSKMLLHCLSKHSKMLKSIEFLESKIDELEHKEAVLTDIIESARSACALVVDRTAQQDLLSGG